MNALEEQNIALSLHKDREYSKKLLTYMVHHKMILTHKCNILNYKEKMEQLKDKIIKNQQLLKILETTIPKYPNESE